MATKTTKVYQIRLDRNTSIPVRQAFVAIQFAIKEERMFNGAVEILISPALGNISPITLVLDSVFLAQNYKSFLPYLSRIPDEPDETAQNPKLPYGTDYYFANTFQLSFSGTRAETLFELSFIHDSVHQRALEKEKTDDAYPVFVESIVAVYSTLGFQKKLISELLRVFKLS